VSDTEKLHLHGSRYIGLRTRYYDDALSEAAGAGTRQTVLLGAGLDTRALRLDLPSDLVLFELDQAGVLDYKLAVLAATPRCRRELVGVDLREDWPAALAAHGHDPARATAWIAEGLLAYLPPDAQAALLARIDELSAAGSRLALDRIVGDPAQDGRLQALAERSGIRMDRLMAGGPEQDIAGALRERGWAVEEEPVAAVAERYGRDLADPFAGPAAAPAAEPPWLDTVFLAARR
jgi:methyltransferase (TIGR00027 family)